MQDIKLYMILVSVAIQMCFVSLDGAIQVRFFFPHFFVFQILHKYYFCDQKEMLLKIRIEMVKLSPGVLVGKPQYGSAERVTIKTNYVCCACRPAWLNCEVWENDFPNRQKLTQAAVSFPLKGDCPHVFPLFFKH